jgi:hypothetical protein
LGAAALENPLLVGILMRLTMAGPEGVEELEGELATLERNPAGVLLRRLRELGIPDELSERIDKAIKGRNRVVHHLMHDPKVAVALETGERMNEIVAEIDRITIDCQQLVNELSLAASPNLGVALGKTLPELAQLLASIDLDTIEDPQIRTAVQFARAMRDALDWEKKPGAN